MTFDPYDPNTEKLVFRRKLPHWRQDSSTYFITWRLADSLPHAKLKEWEEERRLWLSARGLGSAGDIGLLTPRERAEFTNYFGGKIEEWLDAGFGSMSLARPEVSAVVEETLRFFDGERYALGEFVIMPSHVHVIVMPAPDVELSSVLHTWKSFSAKAANKVIGSSGEFWQHESFDHIVRSEAQLLRFERYVRGNSARLRDGEFRMGRGCFPKDGERMEDRSGRLAAGPTLAVSRLHLRHFRCFEQFEAEFAPGVNFIIGPNARGKTSLLEAVCILLRLQSPRVSQLARVVQHGRRGFVTDGFFGARHLQFYYGTQRKKLALDGVEQPGAREWLQLARVMWFGNDDIELVRGSAEKRRRFLDFVAVQRDATYRASLRAFEHALRSRNHLLKQPSPRWREIAAFDAPLLER